PPQRPAARASRQQREDKNQRGPSAQITKPPLLLPRSIALPTPRDPCSQLAAQLRTRDSPPSALLPPHLRCQLRSCIQDIRPWLTPANVSYKHEKSLDHFPKRCPAHREWTF